MVVMGVCLGVVRVIDEGVVGLRGGRGVWGLWVSWLGVVEERDGG